jgi:hypothetical protein
LPELSLEMDAMLQKRGRAAVSELAIPKLARQSSRETRSVRRNARAILRARVAGRLTAEEERASVQALRRFERRCYVVAVTDAVIARVRRPFPVEPIRTLDTVHLATAELLGEPPPLMTIVTRDDRVRENADALGYAVA